MPCGLIWTRMVCSKVDPEQMERPEMKSLTRMVEPPLTLMRIGHPEMLPLLVDRNIS